VNVIGCASATASAYATRARCGYALTMPMPPNELRGKLKGVIAFPVTPFKKDLTLDLEGLKSNVRVLLRQPIGAIVAAAGTGELYSLSGREHSAVVQTVVSEVGNRVPVLAGVGINAAIAFEQAAHAATLGASGFLIFPPYYPAADDDGVLAYYKAVASATELGVLIYNRDWFSASPALVERLASTIPTLIGWKEGQADIRRYQMIRQRVGDKLLWIGGAGDDMVPAYYAMGIRSYTSSIANVAPRLSMRLHELASKGHSQELSTLMDELVIPLYAMRGRRKGYEVSVMKSLMDMMGLAGGPVRPPLVDLKPAEVEELRKTLDPWRSWM
jgi:5-dehydro-4-deoxyglucarate dehydratase